jgi:hypothetical protein
VDWDLPGEKALTVGSSPLDKMVFSRGELSNQGRPVPMTIRMVSVNRPERTRMTGGVVRDGESPSLTRLCIDLY